MEIQRVALVVLILIGFIQLQTFAVLLEHQRRGTTSILCCCAIRGLLERLLAHPFTECIKSIVIFFNVQCSVFFNILYMLASAQISKRHFVSSLHVEPRLIFNGSDNVMPV